MILTADWGVGHKTPDTQNTLIIFLSAIAVIQEIFWTKVISALFLAAGIYSAANLKGL